MMWGPSRQRGDDGDDMDDMGMMGTTCGDHRPWRPHGDLLGTTGAMWGRRGRHGDDGDDRDHMGTTKSLKMP